MIPGEQHEITDVDCSVTLVVCRNFDSFSLGLKVDTAIPFPTDEPGLNLPYGSSFFIAPLFEFAGFQSLRDFIEPLAHD